jgi:hypothetical protein
VALLRFERSFYHKVVARVEPHGYGSVPFPVETYGSLGQPQDIPEVLEEGAVEAIKVTELARACQMAICVRAAADSWTATAFEGILDGHAPEPESP